MTIEGVSVGVAGLQASGPGIPADRPSVRSAPGSASPSQAGAVANQSVSGVTISAPGTSTPAAARSHPVEQVQILSALRSRCVPGGVGPGESFQWINTLGKPEHVQIIPDRDCNEWVEVDMTSYPRHICTDRKSCNPARWTRRGLKPMLDITKAEARACAPMPTGFMLVVPRPADISGLIEAAGAGDAAARQTFTPATLLDAAGAGATFRRAGAARWREGAARTLSAEPLQWAPGGRARPAP